MINHSGIIEANRLTQNAKGEIILLGDMQFGETIVSGMLKAILNKRTFLISKFQQKITVCRTA